MIKFQFLTTARAGGKSVFGDMVQQLMQPTATILTQATVDSNTWYLAKLNMLASDWIRQQDQSLWYEHPIGKDCYTEHCFDIHEKLYSMLILKCN